jgi:hypothetical protein
VPTQVGPPLGPAIQGAIGGTTGTCTCDCRDGYSGHGCETADPCVATSDSSDDGTDGNFYCNLKVLNFNPRRQLISGSDGNVYCINLKVPAFKIPSEDGSDGNFYCINLKVLNFNPLRRWG